MSRGAGTGVSGSAPNRAAAGARSLRAIVQGCARRRVAPCGHGRGRSRVLPVVNQSLRVSRLLDDGCTLGRRLDSRSAGQVWRKRVGLARMRPSADATAQMRGHLRAARGGAGNGRTERACCEREHDQCRSRRAQRACENRCAWSRSIDLSSSPRRHRPSSQSGGRVQRGLHCIGRSLSLGCGGIVGLLRILDWRGRSIRRKRRCQTFESSEDWLSGLRNAIPVPTTRGYAPTVCRQRGSRCLSGVRQ